MHAAVEEVLYMAVSSSTAAAVIEKGRSRRAAVEEAFLLRQPHQMRHQSEFCANRSAFIRCPNLCG